MNGPKGVSQPKMPADEFHVAAEHAGQRLDNYILRECKGLPRQLIYRLLRQGKARLNGSRAKPAARLSEGDRLTLPRLEGGRSAPAVPESAELPPVLHEDEDYLIFDKPAGLAVHGGSGLRYGLIELAREARSEGGLELAHRLDKDTSGVIVLARRHSALRHLHALLREGKVRKDYQAAVWGRWRKEAAGEISAPLRRVEAARGGKRVLVDEGGASSLTRTSCLHQGARGALLSIKLITGKTHQARAHLAHAGLPIIGDERYGDRDANRAAHSAGCRGLFLHARQLTFPRRGKPGDLRITSPLPERFGRIREFLEEPWQKQRG